MSRTLVTFFSLLLCLAATSACSQSKLATPPAISTPETRLRDGTGSLADVLGFCATHLATVSVPKAGLSGERIKIDDDQLAALFISYAGGAGPGGNEYLVFKEGGRGFKLVGGLLFGRIWRVAPDTDGRTRVLTLSARGADAAEIALHVLQPDGFHETASHLLESANSTTADGSESFYKLFFNTGTPPPEALRAVFGAAY